MMPAYFVNTRTNQYEYWETGNVPDIDFMNDQMFVMFDVDKYYQSQWGSEDGTPVSAPKKYIIPTAGVIAGDLDTYNEDSYYVYCDIDALKEVLSREFHGRVIPGQPTRKNGKPYKELFYTRVNVNVGGSGPVGEFGWDGAAGGYAVVDPFNHVGIFYVEHILNFFEGYSVIHPRVRELVYKGLAR